MKVPLSWLADFVEIDIAPRELAEKMTFAGLEVSSMETIGDFWNRETILVGKILGVEPHPNADRLTLPMVEYGQGRAIRLVTGAPNIKVGMSGMKVPLALVGSELIDGHSTDGRRIILKPAKLRGVESAGMVCSERELGLSGEHEGILILPDDAPVGTPLADYLGETVLEVEPTPNLSRCLSILGVAREVAAITGKRVKYPKWELPGGNLRAADLMDIRIENPELSARYCGTYIGNVKIGPSPFWVQRRLTNAGQRPISNVVDATNYVMFELGQPQHSFDYAALRERAGGRKPEIIVRLAREGERIVTLDGAERACGADTLLITDAVGPIAVAGVMGGLETEVTEGTTEVLLESANFNHASIRRATMRFKLPSQASLRFGKGLPSNLAAEASRRGTRLIAELTGGVTAAGIVDCHPRPQVPVTVSIDHHEFSRLLGYHVPEQRVVEVLEGLEFSVSEREGRFIVSVPDYRLDVAIPADLVEEVARTEGYDKLPATLMKDSLPPQERNHLLETEEQVRDFLAACSLEEVVNYSLVDECQSRAWVGLWDPGLLEASGDFLRVANPLSEDRTVMRVGILPGLLGNLAANRRFQKRVAIFEIGRAFRRVPGEARPQENRRLAVLLWGLREESWWGKAAPEAMDFYDIKGIVAGLFRGMHAGEPRLEPNLRPFLAPGRGKDIVLGSSRMGFLGELSAEALAIWDLAGERVAAAEIDLAALAQAVTVPALVPPCRFPAVTQDLAVVVDDALPAADLEGEIRAAGGDLLASVSIFDVYRGTQIPEGKKSLAFSLAFQSRERTLTEEEASAQRDRIVKAVEKRFGAVLR